MIRYKTSLTISIVLLCCNTLTGLAQQQSEERKITITAPDSVIKTAIWDKPMKWKVSGNCTYYWYYAGTINHNQGGFSGKLIHGKFEVFDNQRRLLTQGNFRYGVKQGYWMRWYRNGTIKESCSFKNGKLDGSLKEFDSSGHMLADLYYKNNLLDGKAKYFLKDTVVVKKYRMGKEESAKEHKKWFAKNKAIKPNNGSKISPGETPEKESGKRKLFPWLKRQDSEKRNLEDKTRLQKK